MSPVQHIHHQGAGSTHDAYMLKRFALKKNLYLKKKKKDILLPVTSGNTKDNNGYSLFSSSRMISAVHTATFPTTSVHLSAWPPISSNVL